MKKFEKILFILFIGSILAWFLKYPEANYGLYYIGGFMTYFYVLFHIIICSGCSISSFFKQKIFLEIGAKLILAYLFTGMIISFLIHSIITKLLFWGNAELLLLPSSLLLGFTIFSYFIKKSFFNKQIAMLKRLLFFSLLSTTILSIPNAILVDLKYSNDTEYSTALKEYLDNPNSSETIDRLRSIEYKKLRQFQNSSQH